MNDMNSVLLEGLGYNRERGESIEVRARRFTTGPDGTTASEIIVPVFAIGKAAEAAMLNLIEGQGVRVVGRMIEHDGQLGVGAENIELRRMRVPQQIELEATV
jgi:hypothetical protein